MPSDIFLSEPGVNRGGSAPAPGGLAWTDVLFSPVDLGRLRLSGGIGGGSYTIGVRFYLTRAATIQKIRFAWPTTGVATVEVKLWTGGSAIASATVAVNAAGVYEADIGYAVTSANTYREYYVSTLITSSANYIAYNATSSGVLLNNPPQGGPGLVYLSLGAQASGDAQPGTFQATELSAVEPVLQ